jgi:hypothetical protein
LKFNFGIDFVSPLARDKPAGKNLRLVVAAFMIPHPDKVDRGGEDAYFIGEDSMSMGTVLSPNPACMDMSLHMPASCMLSAATPHAL